MEYDQKMRESLDYIENNLSNNIQLETLSRIAFLSKYHYHRLFHKIIGESVKKYINKRKMACAALELIQSDERIIDIALKYQFGSQEAFSRAFKRIYNITPGEYRKKFTITTSQCIHSTFTNHDGCSLMRCKVA